jgi:hypothetical protein
MERTTKKPRSVDELVNLRVWNQGVNQETIPGNPGTPGNLLVHIVSKRSRVGPQKYEQAGWAVVDVTSTSPDDEFKQLSPYYPVGNLVLPPSTLTFKSVEGAWQGLKVFENEGVDLAKFTQDTMRNMKRNSSKMRGSILGHRFWEKDQNDHHQVKEIIITYVDARKKIYVPLYNQVLARKAGTLSRIRDLAQACGGCVALLDYDTNGDIENAATPLSHASLVAKKLLAVV